MTSIADLRTQLSEDYTRDPNFRVWNQNTVDRALNKGYVQVQTDLGWSSGDNDADTTIALVGGTELYDLPSDFVRLQLAKLTGNGQELFESTRKETREIYSDTTQGTPYWYYLYQNKIGVYPVPNSSETLELQYLKDQSSITVSGSELPVVCDDAICLYAAYGLFLGVRDTNSANTFSGAYQNKINQIRLQLLFDDENIRMEVDRGGKHPYSPLSLNY